MSAPGRSSLVLAIALGVSAGLIVGAPVAFLVARQRSQPTVDAWRLVPIVVAAVDIPQGTTLTMEQISQRSIPTRFVSAAYVRPDAASMVINQRVQTPIEAGAPLSEWMVDETRNTPAAPERVPRGCGQTARALADASTTREVWRLIDALERQEGSTR